MLNSPPLVLRAFSADDRDFFTRLATDPRVVRHVGSGQPWTDHQIAGRIAAALQPDPAGQPGTSHWLIAELQEQPVGLLSAVRTDAGVEIGYWVAPEHWGRGIAGRILDQAASRVLELFGPGTLTARVAPENTASLRLLQRAGFVEEATDGDLRVFKLRAAGS